MIVVFGSLNVDLALQPPSLPAEGKTVLCDAYRTIPGGKGANQAVAAARALGSRDYPQPVSRLTSGASFTLQPVALPSTSWRAVSTRSA